MVSLQGGKSPLNIRGSNPAWEVANKCLNAIEWVEVVEKNKDGPLPSPVISQWLAVEKAHFLFQSLVIFLKPCLTTRICKQLLAYYSKSYSINSKAFPKFVIFMGVLRVISMTPKSKKSRLGEVT